MNAADEIFKALAHPVRRELIAMLAGSAMSVKQLTAAFAISQPAVSQHLRELRAAGLVDADRAGVEQRYRLTGAPLKQVFDWSAQYRRFFRPGRSCLELRACQGSRISQKRSQPWPLKVPCRSPV